MITQNEDSIQISPKQEEFDKLFLEHEARLLRFLLTYTGNYHVSEDAKQEAYLRCREKYPDLKHGDRFLSWLKSVGASIAVNICKKNLFDEDNVQRLVDEHYQSLWDKAAADLLDECIQTERKKIIAAICMKLDDGCRQTFELRFEERKTIEDIAHLTGVSITTVRKRLEKIRTLFLRYKDNLLALTLATTGSSEAALAQVAKQSSVATGSTTASGSYSTFSAASVLSSFGDSFLWFASVWLGFRTWGTVAFQEEPNPKIRRWMLKHFMLFYCGLVFLLTLPLFLFMLHPPALVILQENFRTVRWAVFGCCVGYALCLVWRYDSLLKRADQVFSDTENQVAAENLRWIIFSGVVVSSLLILGCLGGFISGAIPEIRGALVDQRTTPAIIWVVILSLVSVAVLLLHGLTMHRFWRVLAISDVSPSTGTVTQRNETRRVGFSVCVILTLTPSIVHLVFFRTRVEDAYRELIGFIVLWLLIYLWNRLSDQYCVIRIILMALVQFFVIIVLRDFIWLPVRMF